MKYGQVLGGWKQACTSVTAMHGVDTVSVEKYVVP